MSVDKFIITKEDANYSIIPNIICQKLLDAEALGLYVYLLSLPPMWEFYKDVIRKHFGWGRDKLDNKITVLRTHQLVDIVGSRNDKGQFIEWNLHVKNGREFVYPQEPEVQNPENPGTGDLSTGLRKNCTQNTENTAAVKPVTGFSTPIKETNTKDIAYRNKSFCKDQKKNRSDWKAENEKVHDFAESKNQMANETKHIEEHEVIKRTQMPEGLRSMIHNMLGEKAGNNHDRTREGGRMQKDVV